MNLKIVKLFTDTKIPTRGSADAAGWDLYAHIEGNCAIIPPHETLLISTGIAAEIPKGYFGAIYARSGIATKRGLRPANCTGVIDSDYRGQIMVALHNDSEVAQTVAADERIAQLVVLPYQPIDDFDVVETLEDTERGNGGFGSTGDK